MGPRGILRSLIVWSLCASRLGEKLSADQKAPPFARGSGGLVLAPPFQGPTGQGSPVLGDEVQRQEMESYKLVDGHPVRVVEGSFSYRSPENIPVAVMYVADENGNRASFRLGAAAASGGSSATSGGRPATGSQPPGPPASDRTYLPPN